MHAIDEAAKTDIHSYNELKSDVCKLKEKIKKAEEKYYGG
tara:strand:+ start:173 stop:292 length:120 start_codon:yes stop_codon:yes gene_type:complete